MKGSVEELQREGWHVILLPHYSANDYSTQCAPYWWCRKQGLLHNKDFKRISTLDGWAYEFRDSAMATMFRLRWS